MKKHGNRIFLLLIVGFSVFSINACNRDSELGQMADMVASDLQQYSNNGISFNYPAHWVFAYDDTPGLYSTRAIGLKISEYSTASILIEEVQSLGMSAVVDRFEQELRLKSSEFVKDYKRSFTKSSGFNGEKLSWVDTMVGTSMFEIFIIKIQEQPAIFAVISLSDEDIENEHVYIAPFVKSISFQ